MLPDMQPVYDFLKKAAVCYLATCEGQQPRVRPFGLMVPFEDRLYFHTSSEKPVYRQLHENPRVEICAMAGGAWLRIAAEAYEDTRECAAEAVFEGKPQLRRGYRYGDGKNAVFYLKNVTATVSSFKDPTVVYHF